MEHSAFEDFFFEGRINGNPHARFWFQLLLFSYYLSHKCPPLLSKNLDPWLQYILPTFPKSCRKVAKTDPSWPFEVRPTSWRCSGMWGRDLSSSRRLTRNFWKNKTNPQKGLLLDANFLSQRARILQLKGSNRSSLALLDRAPKRQFINALGFRSRLYWIG